MKKTVEEYLNILQELEGKVSDERDYQAARFTRYRIRWYLRMLSCVLSGSDDVGKTE